MAMILMMTLGVSGIYAQEQPLPSSTLVVGTKDAAPFAMKTSEGTWSGISIYLWRRIAADLHLTYEFRELDLKGLLDGVSNGSLDVAVAALSLTPEREKTFDFTHPYYTTGLGIAVASKQRSPWLAVLRRFLSHSFLKVVAALALLLLVVGGIVWWFERKRNPKEFGGSAAKGVGSGFWWSAVTMTAVGYGDKVPVTLGGRIAATIWMFASVVIISSFIAAITSALTVSQLESPVQGPTDLPKVRVGAVANTTGESYLQDN